MLVALLLGPETWPAGALRLSAFDAYQALAPRVRRSAPAVIVAIDEASLARHGQWPWPRTTLARLLERVGEGGPAAVGVVIVMPEPDRLSPRRLPALLPGLDPDLARRLARAPDNDEVLGAALRRLPVALGVVGLDRAPQAGAASGPRTPLRVVGGEPQAFVHRFAGALRSVEAIDAAGAGHGLINPDPGARVVRRLPLIAAVGGDDLLPALGIEMLRIASGAPGLSVHVGPAGVEGIAVGDLILPTERDGAIWIHYAPHDPARFVSAADVLSGRAPPGLFERKLVLVGVTAIGLGDHHPTPVAASMTGVEILAQVLESIFDGDRLYRPAWARWTEAAALAVIGLGLVLAVPALPVRLSALLAVGTLGALLGAGFLAYVRRGLLLDPAGPGVAVVLVFAAILGATLAEAERQRRALRRQLAAEREAAARVAGELEAARRIQMGIVPDPAVLAGETRVKLHAALEPARVVGGDLYDFFRLDGDRLFLLVGDVSGKGVPGSLFMAVSKALCKSSALRQTGDVAATMSEANAEISRDNPEALFVTAWAGVLDLATGRLEYCNAGHEPAWLLPADRKSIGRLGEGGGPPLCVLDDFPYTSASHTLAPGDMLCLVTDGVTEAVGPGGELYGRARLEAVLAGAPAGASPREIGERIEADVARFAGGAEPADDLTVLIVQWLGPAGPSAP